MSVQAQDIATRLGRELTTSESARADVLAAEAELLAGAYLGFIPTGDDDLAAFEVVVARMAARALSVPDDQAGVSTWSESLGAYSASRQFATGSRDGGPWLSESDRVILDRIAGATGAGRGLISIQLVSDRTA